MTGPVSFCTAVRRRRGRRSAILPRPAAARGIAALVAVALVAGCSKGEGEENERERAPQEGEYVALGDSLSSGAGAGSYASDEQACFRSSKAWAHVVDRALEPIEAVEMRACGGARAPDIVGRRDDLQLGPQVPGRSDSGVTLVTLTVGVNDIDYGGFLFACASAHCGQPPREAEEAYQRRLVELRSTLADDVYPAVRSAYPEARITHVGYPLLVTRRPSHSCSWLEPDEQVILKRVMEELNATIAAAVSDAAEHDIEYLDATGALTGHELCSEDPWIVPLDGEHGGHPQAAGYRAIADTVLRSFGE